MKLANCLRILIYCVLLSAVILPAYAVWDLESDTWVATDALGRTLPGSAICGAPKANKTVGIFYFLWLSRTEAAVTDITKLLAANPTNPAWGPRWSFHHWGESELGYYASDDIYVVRKHCQMLVDAGIDVLCFDVTNGVVNTYPDKYLNLCAVFQQIRNEGGKTPQICFVVNSESAQVVQKLYTDFYSQNLYPDLWYYWLGKPLMLAPPDGLSSTLLNFFTLRKTWAWNTGEDNWNFMDKYPQHVGYHLGTNEQVSVAVAEHPLSNIGRSCQAQYNSSTGQYTTVEPATDQYYLCPTKDQGLYFAQQWSRVGTGTGQVSPPFVFVTGWNEWIAQRFIEGLDATGLSLCGRPLQAGDTFFVDAFTQEFSRDIEPMKGGHTDNYYYQLTGNIRKYKGVRQAMGTGPARTISIDGSFSDWNDVEPEYRDTVGDTEHRNSIGYASANTYVNNTGRNDFVRMKVARDAGNLYFYAETCDNITSDSDIMWMLLFLDTDCNAATGWNGYDYVVNLADRTPNTTTLYRSLGSDWEPVASNNAYRVTGNKLEIAIPRANVGKSGTANVALDFHWADNIQEMEITEFFVSGDSAPNRRFNYHYDSAASGPPWEFDTAGNLEGWQATHSIANLITTGGALTFNISGDDPYATGPRYPDINADVYRYIKIRMKSTGNTAAEFFWGTQAEPYHKGGREVGFTVINDGQFHEYEVDMAVNAEWQGLVNTLRLDPSSGSTGHVEIDYIRIFPDYKPPTGSVYGDPNSITQFNDVTLSLVASDVGSGVSKMRFSNDTRNWSAWENYASTKVWRLASGEGNRIVFVQYRDRQYNASDFTDCMVTVDINPPTGTVTINSGQPITASPSATLNLSASDLGTSVNKMRFSNDNATWTAWENYANTKPWTLPSTDGIKRIYVQYMDVSGNVSASVSASTVLDTTGPDGAIGINDANEFTTSTAATLLIVATDEGSGVVSMRFSNMGSSWSSWEAYSSPKSWTLGSGDGEKRVYAQFKDGVGNISSTSQSIILDTTAPSVPGIPTDAGAFTNDTSIVFNWTAATDSSSGIDGYNCEIGSTPGGKDVFSGNVGGSLSWVVTGSIGRHYYCRVQARDRVGYTSSWSANSDGITIVNPYVTSVQDAKALADLDSVGLSSKAVTAVFGDEFYVENEDRSAGMRVKPLGEMPLGLNIGSLVDIGGVLKTNADQERWLEATVKVLTGSSSILPMAMNNRYLGGGDWQVGVSPARGQKGVTGATGLNNIGLLIRTYGTVVPIDSSNFSLSDGSGVSVRVTVPSGVVVPTSGSYVVITGISSCYTSAGSLTRLVLVRNSTDILQVK